MTLSNWIKNYCEENDITLPEGIPDEKTALQFLSVNASGGGGNPNSVEVINATLENPFGNMSMSDIVSLEGEFWYGNASGKILLETEELFGDDYNDTLIQRTDRFEVNSISIIDNAVLGGIEVVWGWAYNPDPTPIQLNAAYVILDGVIRDVKDLASQIPTVLTIYHHPMPENN